MHIEGDQRWTNAIMEGHMCRTYKTGKGVVGLPYSLIGFILELLFKDFI